MIKLIGRITNSLDRGEELSFETYDKEKNCEDEEDSQYVFFTNSFEVELNNKFKVFQMIINVMTDVTLKFLRDFDSFEKAEEYGKIQYYRKTDDYPFITSGMTSSYKTSGKRKKIAIPENILFEGAVIDDDSLQFIAILQEDKMKAFSLDEFGVWT